MTDQPVYEMFERVSKGTPTFDRERWYASPDKDADKIIFKVKIDTQGDALINNEALDILLRLAGFEEIAQDDHQD